MAQKENLIDSVSRGLGLLGNGATFKGTSMMCQGQCAINSVFPHEEALPGSIWSLPLPLPLPLERRRPQISPCVMECTENAAAAVLQGVAADLGGVFYGIVARKGEFMEN